MKRWGLVGAVLALACGPITPCLGQPVPIPRVMAVPPAPPGATSLRGSVYLRSGVRISGALSLVRLGNGSGAALDATADRGGTLRILVDDTEATVHGDEVRTVVAVWQQFGEVSNLVGVNVVKTDGSRISGRPAWGSTGTRVDVTTDDGQTISYRAIRDEPGYNPNNLVLLVDVSGIEMGRLPPVPLPPLPTATEPRSIGQEVFGTVTLRDGRQFRGDIRLAEWGVMANDGIGSARPDGGGLALVVNGQKRTIPAWELRRARAEWVNAGSEAQPDWRIASVSVLTRGGEEIVGRPAWQLATSNLQIDPVGGGPTVRVHAFPMSRKFDPNNVITKIELR